MTDLHSTVRANPFVPTGRKAIWQWKADGNDIDHEDTDGHTALAVAVMSGKVGWTRGLINDEANPNRRTRDGQTLLHLAVVNKNNTLDIVKVLLEKGIKVDEPEKAPPRDTPLMKAIRHNAGPAVIKALRDAGASLTDRNRNGESAQDLIDRMGSNKDKDVVLPPSQQGKGRPELANLIASVLLLALAWLRAWTWMRDAIIAAIRQMYNEVGKPGADDNATTIPEKPKTRSDCEKLLDRLIKELGLEDFYDLDSDVIQKIIDALLDAIKNGKHDDKSAEDIQECVKLALYQPVLYLDDSGSMKEQDRKTHQDAIVELLADVLNTYVPKDKGVHIRFINRADSFDFVAAKDIAAKMNFTPDGGTRLGTSLNSKVLTPLVYTPIQANQNIEKPLLIITTTDGLPNEENADAYRNAITDCAKNLKAKGYEPKRTIRFLVNQVGNDQAAKAFLDGLDQTSKTADLKGLLHRTAEQLDVKYLELRNNRKALRAWLIAVLTAGAPSP